MHGIKTLKTSKFFYQQCTLLAHKVTERKKTEIQRWEFTATVQWSKSQDWFDVFEANLRVPQKSAIPIS
jgi:hypothetical protein